MNILMVGPGSKEKGGIATVIYNFQQYYNHNEHKLLFLSSWSEEHKWQTMCKAFWLIRRKIKQEKIEIVHFHVAQKGSFFRKALLRKLVPKECKVIFHMHASQFDVFYQKSSWIVRLWIRKTLNKVDSIVALSQNWAEFYEGITDAPVAVIQNAVHIPKSSLYNMESTTIVTFGKIGKRKGSYDLLKIAKEIEKEFPKIDFILYGDGEIEKLSQQIEVEQIKNVSIGGWINQDKKEEVLRNMLLHFLPSYHEGLPMAILETMAAGIPNLTTSVGGIPEAIDHEKNGLLTEPGDRSEMINQLYRFLRSSTLQKKYGECARKTIKEDFSIGRYHEKWSSLYIKLVRF